MNTANKLTILRMILVPVFLVLYCKEKKSGNKVWQVYGSPC